MAKLRDDVVLESTVASLKMRLTGPIVQYGTKISVDRAAFLECYSRIMMRFRKLTPHQREKLKELRAANVAVLLSPAGGGKTFLAIQRVLEELRGDAGAVVLFVARNTALALFVCKWLVAASRKSAERVVKRVHVLVAPFEDGPRRVRVDGRRLVLDAVGEEVEVCAGGRRRGAPPRERCRAACAARRYWRCSDAPIVARGRFAGDGDARRGRHRALARGSAAGAESRGRDALRGCEIDEAYRRGRRRVPARGRAQGRDRDACGVRWTAARGPDL